MTQIQTALIAIYVIVFFGCATAGFIMRAKSDDDDPDIVAAMFALGIFWPIFILLGAVIGIVAGIPYGLSLLIQKQLARRTKAHRLTPKSMPNIYADDDASDSILEKHRWMDEQL